MFVKFGLKIGKETSERNQMMQILYKKLISGLFYLIITPILQHTEVVLFESYNSLQMCKKKKKYLKSITDYSMKYKEFLF